MLTAPSSYALSASQYGLLFLPQVILAISGSLAFPALSGRRGLKPVLLAGMAADVVAMALLVGSYPLRTDTIAHVMLLTATAFLGSDQVGRNYVRHNSQAVMAISEEPNPTKFQKTLAMNDWYGPSAEWEFPMGGIQMLGKSDAIQMAANAPSFTGRLAPKMPLEKMAHHALDFWLSSEDLPRPENRVTIDNDGAVRLTVDDRNNIEGLVRLRKALDSRLGDLGAHHGLLDHGVYLHKSMPVGATAHQAGTCRFGSDPASSVLDLDCRAHEVDNLYVVDSSFFPSIGAVNPTLTIIANALRVGAHLTDRLA